MGQNRMNPRLVALGLLFAGLAAPAGALPPASARTPSPAASTSAPPSCSTPEYRQFDFWLGDWDVTGADGKAAGHNKIAGIVNGCALQENWTSVKGGRATSVSVYDGASRRWHQTWVDDSGGLLLLEGEFRDGKMLLVGRRPSQRSKGTMIIHRITWTPLDPDRVHQLWEASGNEGRTWTTVVEGTYIRKK